MLLPNLFIPGAAKSGTSSLHDYLDQHPDIYMSRVKEPHFFSRDQDSQQDQPANLSDYAKLFSDGAGCKLRGESSTGYMVFPHVVERISKMIKSPRFIFILRNPIDRAYSHYWWLRGKGFEDRDFRDAVLADMDERPNPDNRVPGFGGYRYYFAFSQYGTYMRQFVDTFGLASICIITTEELSTEPLTTINRVLQFLELNPLDEIVFSKSNETVVYHQPQLYHFLYTLGSQPLFSRLLHRLVSESTLRLLLKCRKSLVDALQKRLRSEVGYPFMQPDDRQWLRELYSDEVCLLRKITGLQFREWQADFPVNIPSRGLKEG